MLYTYDSEPYNTHTESAEIDKWPLLSTKVGNVEHNRKVFSANRVKFNPTKERCFRRCRQIRKEDRSCREVDFSNMTEQPQTDCLDIMKGFKQK